MRNGAGTGVPAPFACGGAGRDLIHNADKTVWYGNRMVTHGDIARFKSSSWLVALAIAFALALGSAGQAFADDLVSDDIERQTPVALELPESDDGADSVGDEAGEIADLANVADAADVANSLDAHEGSSAFSHALNGGPATIAYGLSDGDDIAQVNAKPREADAEDEPADQPADQPAPAADENEGAETTSTGGLPNATSAPGQTAVSEDSNGPERAEEPSQSSNAKGEEKAPEPAKAEQPATPAGAGWVCEPAYDARQFDCAYEQAASELQAQRAEDEPAEQPVQIASQGFVRWTGSSDPDVPVIVETSTSRVNGPSPTFLFALVPNAQVYGPSVGSKVADETQNSKGSLLYRKARCRSP